jgi:hypothetical protein
VQIIDSHIALGEELHLHCDTHAALDQMDQHNIALSIARPMGSELVSHNTAGNDRILSTHARIRGLISVNPSAFISTPRAKASSPPNPSPPPSSNSLPPPIGP